MSDQSHSTVRDLDHIDAYTFALPPEQIATHPAATRSASRLLVVDDPLRDRAFADIADMLSPGDLLVVNDAKVTPVRLSARRATGGAVEVFVIGFGEEGRWDDASAPLVCLTKSNKRLRPDERLDLVGTEGALRVVKPIGETPALIQIEAGDTDVWALFEQVGDMPLPPYIANQRKSDGEAVSTAEDRTRYQTVFATQNGAVAAPTAGLHFDAPLLAALAAKGVRRASVTLRVGIGTFAPVRADRLSEHTLHREFYNVPEETRDAIAQTHAAGGRVVAVGTTVVRTLEAAARGPYDVQPGEGDTALFIRPGYPFQVIDALITNFHLPASTLLALVAAFGGYERVTHAYQHAIAHGYRFYSYGDAMFLPQRDRNA